jgi:hypothetical protein
VKTGRGKFNAPFAKSSLTLSDCLVEDPATGLYRPRDYLQSLEARVAYLEGLLQQVNPEVALDHLGSIDTRLETQNSAAFAPIPTAS